MKNGTYSLDGMTIFIRQTDKVHALDERVIQESYGYFESDTFETIQSFFEKSSTYTKNQVNNNKVKDKIKILSFDYQWQCDSYIPKKTFSAIHLPPKILKEFRDDIESFFSSETKQSYEILQLNPSRIYGLYGPPGTGKTTLIHTIASHYSMNIACISFDHQMHDRSFKMALKKLPTNTILCLEDIDALFNEDRKSAETCLTFSGIINALDGILKIKDLVIFVTTNHLQKLDSALKRRIDYFVKFDFCVKGQVKAMFERFEGLDNFDRFWKECSKLKVTPSILQKFFLSNFHKQFDDYIADFKDFVEGEYGLEKMLAMYS
jgi:chaperone BCS1